MSDISFHGIRRVTETWRTATGETLRWSEIKDGHLLYIVRHLARRIRRLPIGDYIVRIGDTRVVTNPSRSSQQAFSLAIDEVEWHGLLPTWDELLVSWDRACAGHNGAPMFDPYNIDRNNPTTGPWCLIDLWVGYPDKLPEPAVYDEPPAESESASVMTAQSIAAAINEAHAGVVAIADDGSVRVTFDNDLPNTAMVTNEQHQNISRDHGRRRRTPQVYTSRATAGPALHRRLSR